MTCVKSGAAERNDTGQCNAPEAIAAVIGVLRRHVSAGEMDRVESVFTTEVRSLFG